MKEYSFSIYWRVLTFLFAPAMLYGCVYLSVLPFKDDYGLTAKILLFALGLSLAFVVVMAVIEVVKTKLIIKNKEIIKRGIFSTRILKFKEIKGYSQNDNYLFITPLDPKHKSIKISTYVSGKYELMGEISSRFTNLEAKRLREEKNKVLKNKKFGKDSVAVKKRIAKLKKLTIPLNIAITILSVLFMMYIVFYEIQLLVMIAAVIYSTYIWIKNEGLINLVIDEESPNPNLSFALGMPACAMLIRFIVDYNIYDYYQVFIITIITTIAIVFFLYKKTYKWFAESKVEKVLLYSLLSLGVGLYVFFTAILINCTFDYGSGSIYPAQIVDKKIIEGEDDLTHNITVTGIRGEDREVTFEVSRKRYKLLTKGKYTDIVLMDGLLNIPWYFPD